MNRTVLSTLYPRAVGNVPLLGTPSDLADQLEGESREETAEAIIRLHTVLCGGTGFACGVPGYASMPLTVPANIAGVLLLQLHMTAAVATTYGHDIENEDIRARCLQCVQDHSESVSDGSDAWPVLQRLTVKLGERGLRYLGEQAVHWVAKTKRTRSLPVLGGVVGGVSDGYATRKVGRAAQHAFSGSQSA